MALRRDKGRRLKAALRNDGLPRIDSLRASMSLAPILMSLARDGTRPQRAINNRRSTESSSSRSAMMGMSWVGVTFQLDGGGLPSTSFASNWLRRSPAA